MTLVVVQLGICHWPTTFYYRIETIGFCHCRRRIQTVHKVRMLVHQALRHHTLDKVFQFAELDISLKSRREFGIDHHLEEYYRWLVQS